MISRTSRVTVMAKTASLNATSRPGVRCTEGGSCPALPPGARAVVNECTQRVTEAAHALLAGGGIRTDGSHWCGLPRAVTRQLPEVPALMAGTRPVIAISMDTAVGHWPERRAQCHRGRNRADGHLERRQACV